MTSPQELKQIISHGLLSFPLTDFDADGSFRPSTHAERLEWLAPYGASALFAAGGTGEFFSLTQREYSDVIRVATETCKGKVPISPGAGGATRVAIEYAQEAERLGASGVLLMPHYLTEASQEGIADHVEQVCRALKIGVVVYNRANSKLNADMLERLADRCPNLIGFKGRCRRNRKHGDDPPPPGDRFAYLRRPADGRSLRGRIQGALGAGVFVGRIQLHPEDGDGILRSDREGRPRHGRPPDRRILPAVPEDPQSPRGLCGQHREGGREARRP